MSRRPAKVRIVCAGNAYRGDDGLGLAVADVLERSGLPPGVQLLRTSGGVADLLECWNARSRVLLVDAASGSRPGTVHRIDATAAPIPARLRTSSTHALSIAQAVELARTLDRLPARLIIFAVEGEAFDIGRPLSQAVATTVDRLAQQLATEAAALQHEGG